VVIRKYNYISMFFLGGLIIPLMDEQLTFNLSVNPVNSLSKTDL
jgi:hypothetical protein